MLNALSVDLEDYFHVSAFEGAVNRDNWPSYPSRIAENTRRLSRLLQDENVKATFFVLGWVAEHFPELVEELRGAGHEIATHGYEHRLVYEQTPEEFRSDVSRSLDILQGITGEKAIGYRAPSFSIVEETLWATEILQRLELRYDSSIFPARPLVHNRYGLPGSSKKPYQIRSGFWEFPMSSFRFLGMDFPVGGGGWLRHYPYEVTRWGVQSINDEGCPAVIYVHPWELDPDQPRLNGGLWRQFLHYRNLDKTASRLRALFRDFQFAPISEVLNNWTSQNG